MIYLIPVAVGAYLLYSSWVGASKSDPTTAQLVVSKWGEDVNRILNIYRGHLKGDNLNSFNVIDDGVILAIISVESSGNERALGRANEIGLMQIMPNNVEHLTGNVDDWIKNRHYLDVTWLSNDPWHPQSNIHLGIQNLWNEIYIKQQHEGGSVDLDRAIRGYNVGFGKAKANIKNGFEYLQKVRAAQNMIFNVLAQA